jgi:hypothetical protein
MFDHLTLYEKGTAALLFCDEAMAWWTNHHLCLLGAP